MSKGQRIIVRAADRTIRGSIRFANDHFISVDEGDNVTAILRRDENLNRWVMGKIPVDFTVE